MDPGNASKKILWTHKRSVRKYFIAQEIPTGKKLGLLKDLKNFGPRKYVQENILNPQKVYEKIFWTPEKTHKKKVRTYERPKKTEQHDIHKFWQSQKKKASNNYIYCIPTIIQLHHIH